MGKNILVLLFLLVFAHHISLAQEVWTTSGGNIINASTEVTWTIGETLVEGMENSNTTVTTGFNQPVRITITNLGEDELFPGFSVFPNPTKHWIHFSNNDRHALHIQLLSLDGQVLISEDGEGLSNAIDISTFVNGTYLMAIKDLETGHLAFRRIIKY